MKIKGECKEEILAVFAHELRQPLASILFAIQWATETPAQEDATREMCEIVERQSRYLIRMIDGVLEDCRDSQTKSRLHKEWFDLSRVVEDAIEATCAMISMREHHLNVTLPQESLWIHADALRVQQIVVNLVTNAAKYTESGGCIQLSVKHSGNSVVIEVRDSGIGIAKEMLPRVFDLFCQGEAPSLSGVPGLGIGLAVVKSLVELHGGTVGVQSGGIGKGSTFVVRLPSGTPHVHPGNPGQIMSPRRSDATRFVRVSPMSDA